MTDDECARFLALRKAITQDRVASIVNDDAAFLIRCVLRAPMTPAEERRLFAPEEEATT